MSLKCDKKQESLIKVAIKKFFRFTPNSDLEVLDKSVADIMKVKEAKVTDYAYISGIKNLLTVYGVKDLDVKTSGPTSYKTNILNEIASFEVSDLFHGITVAKLHFEGFLNEKMLKHFFVGDGIGFIEDDVTLTKSFANLKNDMFKDIQSFLHDEKISNLKIPKDLYSENFEVIDFDNYKSVMTLIKDYFFDGKRFEYLQSHSDKKVPNFDDSTTEKQYNAYFNMIFLANFDSVVRKNFNHLVSINSLYVNDLVSPLDPFNKYKRVFKPESTVYWSNGEHSDESVENTNVKMVEMVVNSIPAYNKSDTNAIGHMEMKDLYLLAAVIVDYELKNGNRLRNNSEDNDFEYFSTNSAKRLLWYLDNIEDESINNKTTLGLTSHFEKVSNITNSLRRFLYDPKLGILEKEKNSRMSVLSMLGQVISNSFGATYSVVEVGKGLVVQQMYSQDFNSTGMNNTLYSQMKSSYHEKKSYYNLTNKKEAEIFKDLFEGVHLDRDIHYTLESDSKFARKVKEYIHNKMGLRMSVKALNVAISNLKNTTSSKAKNYSLSVYDFQQELKKFIDKAHVDMNSIELGNAVERSSTNTKFDSTVGELVTNSISTPFFKAISEGFLVDMPIKSVMNVNTADGNSLPSYKTANLTYKDTESFDQQRRYEKSNGPDKGTFKSMLILDDPAILGTSTKLEVSHNSKSKSAATLSPIESLTMDIEYEFFNNLIKPLGQNEQRSFNVIIGAYSDKSTILTKMINAEFAGEDSEGGPIIKRSVQDIKELVRSQSAAYFRDTILKTFRDYDALFNALNLYEKYDIPKLLWEGNASELRKNIDIGVESINKVLADNSVSRMVADAQLHNIHITEELHYSKYSNGTFYNQNIYDNYSIFNNTESDGSYSKFNTFTEQQQKSFIDNFYKVNTTVEGKLFTNDSNTKLDEFMDALGMNKELYISEDLTDITMSNGDLNPLAEKWMWINALYRNEYLYVTTKGEYIHPHKLRGHSNRYVSDNKWDAEYWKSYNQEVSGRLSVMSKRNVVNTSTYEAPTQNSKWGITSNLNIASMQDHTTSPYSITGDRNYKRKFINGKWVNQGGLDAHDGSSWMDYAYSKMVDASFPSKGYEGTKKQFGTFVSQSSVMIKKDAESVLTNAKIQESRKGSISMLNMKRKMLSIPLGDLSIRYMEEVQPNFYFNEGGRLYKINIVNIANVGGQNKVFLDTSVKEGDAWRPAAQREYDVNTLYDLWTAFGAQYSTDAEGNFNESSNELLYEVMVNAKAPDKSSYFESDSDVGKLKNKLIHIVSNKSALKAGATNINPETSFSDDTPLVYGTFESKFMGPQLDASHSADDSTIKEITQIISALAQGGFTADMAREVYQDIQNIIREESKKYVETLHGKDADFYKVISDSFIKSVLDSKEDTIAKTMITHLQKSGINIPFSNQHFYVEFVRGVISKMNDDFISRYYPGIGAVIVPSQGIVQMYDVPVMDGDVIVDWRIASQNDFVKEALATPDNSGRTNDQIVDNYIENLLQPVEVLVEEVKIGDRILFNGQETYIETPEDYYHFKDSVVKGEISQKEILNRLYVTGIIESDVLSTLVGETNEEKISNLIDVFGIKLVEDPIIESLLRNLGEYLTKDLPLSYTGEEDAASLLGLFITELVNGGLDVTEAEALSVNRILTRVGILNDVATNTVLQDFSDYPVSRVLDKPRDLKPTLHTFKINGKERNIFDIKAIKYRYLLENYISNKNTEHIVNEDLGILNNLIDYIANFSGTDLTMETLLTDPSYRSMVFSFLELWKQRDLSLLSLNLITADVDSNTVFEDYFLEDDLVTNIVEDVVPYYVDNGLQVTDLAFRPAELMTADIFRSKFGRDTKDSLYEIKKQGYSYFKDKLRKNYEKDHNPSAFKIYTSRSDKPIYIRFVDKLKDFGDALNITVNNDKVGRENPTNLTRYNEQGEPIYDIIDDKVVGVMMEGDNEIIQIKIGDKIIDDSGKTLDFTYHKTQNLEKILNKVIQSFDGTIQTMVPLMIEEGLIKTFQYEGPIGRSAILEERAFYDLNNLVSNQFKKFTGTNHNLPLKRSSIFQDDNLEIILDELAKKAYASWEKSHDIVSSRIPAQSMQSFMPMQVVGYTDGSKNDAYVSVSQIWLQGSDFDIDKAYLMGHSFDNNGHYNSWSNITNYSSKAQLNALDSFPMPNNRVLKGGEKDSAIVDEAYQKIVSQLWVDGVEGGEITKELSAGALNAVSDLIRFINKNGVNSITISEGLEFEQYTLSDLVKLINRHNKATFGKAKSNSLKNGVVSKINRIISSISNQLMANTPISIQNWHDAVDTVRKNSSQYVKKGVDQIFATYPRIEEVGTKNQYSKFLNIKNGANNSIETFVEDGKVGYMVYNKDVKVKADDFEFLKEFKKFVDNDSGISGDPVMTPYDVLSYYMMQYNAAVGKDDVGIAANGIKAFFGLTDYYNHFYTNKLPNMSDADVRTSGNLISKDLNFYNSKGELIEMHISSISDMKVSKKNKEMLSRISGRSWSSIQSNAAMNLSNFLSGATDNAKELLMAKVNADKDLASMHIYLSILGVDVENIVEIMTSEVAKDILTEKESNIFKNEFPKGIEGVFKKLEKAYKGRPDIKNVSLSLNLETFIKIYRGSKELTALAGMMGVNKKRKANTWELYKFLARFENLFNSTQNNVMGEGFKPPNNFDEAAKWEPIVSKILKNNPALSPKEDAKYVLEVLKKANEFTYKEVVYGIEPNEKLQKRLAIEGESNEKTVSILNDGLDFRLYINNAEYNKIAREYFRLIKDTFNVLDIMEEIPHYNEMVNSLVLTHNMLSRASKKYTFVTTILKDVITKGNNLVTGFDSKYIDEYVIGKGMYFFDTLVAESWLKTISDDFSFKVKDLMRLANVETYTINISNGAKDNPNLDGQIPTRKVINLYDTSVDPIITLDSAYNIAQFKQIVEQLVLKAVQAKVSNGFTDNLKVESVMTPFRTRGTAVVSTFPLKDMSNPVYATQFQKLLSAFDSLDVSNTTAGSVSNSYGRPVNLRDMFYIYNLITNNERTGNKRLTTMFENYHKESNSLGLDYVKHWAKVESGEVDLFGDLSDETVMNKLEDNIMFHIANDKGRVAVKRDGKSTFYEVSNTDFVLIGDVALTREQEKTHKNLRDTLRILKDRGLMVYLKC